MKQRLGFKPMMSKGNFWICFDDFLREFEDVYVCRLFRTVHGDLLEVEHWQGIQDELKNGKVPQIQVYPDSSSLGA